MGAQRSFSMLFAAALLAACGPGTGTDDTPSEAPAQEQPEPEADPGPGQAEPEEPTDSNGTVEISFPGCGGILTDEDLGYYFFENPGDAELIPTPANWGDPAEHAADEHLRPLLGQTQDPHSCTWGIPGTDNFFTIIIAPVTPALADEVEAEITAQGYPDMRPPTRGYSFNDDESMSSGVHLVEGDLWLVFQGGPGSINADDADRHGFATVLGNVSDRIQG